jgi:hypothetical protein
MASKKKTFPKNLGDNDWPIGMRPDGEAQHRRTSP